MVVFSIVMFVLLTFDPIFRFFCYRLHSRTKIIDRRWDGMLCARAEVFFGLKHYLTKKKTPDFFGDTNWM